MNNENISFSNLLAEKQLICWMYTEKKFCDIPPYYITNRNLRDIFNHYRDQYFEHGEIIPLSVPETLMEHVADAAEYGVPARPDIIITELKKAYMVREFYTRFIEVERNIDRDKNHIVAELSAMSKHITAMLTEVEESKEYNHKKSVFEFLQKIEDAKKSKNEFRGIPSHLPDLDKIISGWQTGVYLISGLEKLGKSRFVRSLVSPWLQAGHGCVMFMLEEDENAIHECILANRCTVNTDLFGTSNIQSDAIQKVFREGNLYMNDPLYISTKSSITPNYVKTVIQRQKIKMSKTGHKLKFAVIDYVQRMGGDGKDKHEQTEYIASELANIAKDEQICLIEVSQMSSGAEKTKGTPLHTQIRFGKVFKEAANCIITFDDPERSKKKDDADSWGVSQSDAKNLLAHIIQRKGISDITMPIRAQLQFSSFHNAVR